MTTKSRKIYQIEVRIRYSILAELRTWQDIIIFVNDHLKLECKYFHQFYYCVNIYIDIVIGTNIIFNIFGT